MLDKYRFHFDIFHLSKKYLLSYGQQRRKNESLFLKSTTGSPFLGGRRRDWGPFIAYEGKGEVWDVEGCKKDRMEIINMVSM